MTPRQVRKCSPLRSPQSLGSINPHILHIHDLQTGQRVFHTQPQSLGSIKSYILHIHDLKAGQKILPFPQSSVPWEYKLKYSSYSWPSDRSEILPSLQSSVPWEYKHLFFTFINSRQVRKYSPLCSSQPLGSIISYLLIHQLQTGQKILPSLQSSVPWEYQLISSSHS